jgi:hypothetical protein
MLYPNGHAVVADRMEGAMSKEPGPRERALREMREARFAENAKISTGIRKAAAAGADLLQKVKATSERMKNKPAKGKRKRK